MHDECKKSGRIDKHSTVKKIIFDKWWENERKKEEVYEVWQQVKIED